MEQQLDVDIQRKALLQMPYADIINACMINQHFHTTVCNDTFWEQMILRDLGVNPANLPVLAAGISRRNLYHIMNRLQGLPLGRNDIGAILASMGYPL